MTFSSVVVVSLLLAPALRLPSASAASCIPNPRGASTNWYSLFKSAAENPFDDYLSQTLEAQCGFLSDDASYCLSNVEACVKPCSDSSECVVTLDPNEGLRYGYTLQQKCLDFTESGGILTVVPPPQSPAQKLLQSYPAPLSSGTSFPVLPYPDSNFKFCGCEGPNQCRQSERCFRGVCMCSADSDCGPGRICTWGRRPWNFMNRSPDYREVHDRGQCECDITKGSAGCNGHGACVQISPAGGDANGYRNRAHVQVARVPSGAFQRPAACACYGGFKGKYCEIASGKQTFCSDRGEPLVSVVNTANTLASSRNTGAPISNQFLPDYTKSENARTDADFLQSAANNLARSAGRQACICEPGWGPDFLLSNTNPSTYISDTPKCNALIPCYNAATGSVVGTVFGGECKCSGDFYDQKGKVGILGDATFGSCTSGCAATICSGRGQCSADPKGSTTFNSACNCNTGFTTSGRQIGFNSQTQKYADKRFCDVPYDPQDAALPTQITCGRYGTEVDVPGYPCRVKEEWQYLGSTLAVNPRTQLLTRSCGKSENPLYRDLTCGGEGRGSCVSDGRQGSMCQCSNGLKGLACDELVCPVALYVNGGVCSGNGYCDNPTLRFDDPSGKPSAFKASKGRCVCKAGFIGDACEKVRLDCGVGQTQRNYPLLQNITSIVSLQQLSTLQP